MISIVLPVHNRPEMLHRCIQSVLRQKETNWELIVVDDGSTDDTVRNVQQFLTDNRISLLQLPKSGSAIARNTGAASAKGDFLVFLDSDDEVTSDWLSAVQPALQDHIGLFSVGCTRITDGVEVKSAPQFVSYAGLRLRVKYLAGCFFIRKTLFDAAGGFDENLKTAQMSTLCYRLMSVIKTTSLTAGALDVYPVRINIHRGIRIRNDYPLLSSEFDKFILRYGDGLYNWNKKELANQYAVNAFYKYKCRNKPAAMQSIFKAITLRPLRISNYARAVKYLLG